MKSGLFVISLLILLIHGSLHANNDTLRMHDPENVLTNYYNTTTHPNQLARFDLPKPAIIKGFEITLMGEAGSTVNLNFLGHEGGVALISLKNNIVPTITVTKLQDGKEQVYVALDSPFIKMNNTQFFLLFNAFNGAGIVTDRTNHPYSCKSSSGGDYYYQYGINNAGEYRLLSNFNRAFAIDVILEYPDKESQQIFLDVTLTAGIDENLSNSTIAAADYNDDGFVDLLIRGRLYKNLKNGNFEDVSHQLGIVNPYSAVVANAFVDNDNDGDLDIFLFGSDTSVLLINNGNIFTEIILNFPEFKAFLSFSFADINNDNYPDLFVSQLWKTYPEPELNYFFYNTGSNNFTDNTNVIYPEYDGNWNWPGRTWDPANYAVERNRNSRGSQWVDFDNDGDLDLFVTNYFLQPDEFYRNNGDGSFTDICQVKGIDKNNTGSNHGTGVDWYDFDNDGNLDLLLPQFAHPRFIGDYDHRGTTIYRNKGAPDFEFTDLIGQYNNYSGLKSDIGFELEETHAGGAWGDVNNDGLADVLLTVFYGCRYIDMYEQQEDNSFKLETFKYGLSGINTGTDLVWLDYDNDGRLDLAGAIAGKFRLFKNNQYNSRRWIELDLKSKTANKYSIGARASVYVDGKILTQEVCAGRGQKMQKPYRLHFGLGYNPTIDSIMVTWPTQPPIKERFDNLNVNEIYTLTQGGQVFNSIENLTKDQTEIRVYPNPASSKLYVSGQDIKRIRIMSTIGQMLLNISVNNINPVQIDLSAFKNGMYALEIETETDRELRFFMVNKP
ncbi:MAG: T9SS type A sorting domain-containing protein [Cytophagia bacterium]|nr:T9SS type A sorting domain-containing protein [Cytophagia bacterium]